jgi:hypothetical protein
MSLGEIGLISYLQDIRILKIIEEGVNKCHELRAGASLAKEEKK